MAEIAAVEAASVHAIESEVQHVDSINAASGD
jgi:hypothetical protein